MNQGKTLSISLRTGRLLIAVKKGQIPLSRLLGFSSRINSKRGFLFVSKVLGKHYPVRPRVMAWSYRALARRILEQNELSTASLWIGMAETATGLGYGVYESAHSLGLENALFMQTTRYHLSKAERLEFFESHSHATDFFLYWPEDDYKRSLFLNARQLILIDDEISTGATFLRLIEAYRAVNPYLEKIVVASLVNFASAKDRQLFETKTRIPVQWASLLEGQWQFEPSHADMELFNDESIRVIGGESCKRNILAWPGRVGIDKVISFTEANVSRLLEFFPEKQIDTRPILVLGTGECNPPAYLLGRQLERMGYAVIVQATTRSPIYVEGDIASKMRFTDNYQDGIHNFLYNINPVDYSLIVFCHETPLTSGSDSDELDFIGVIKKLNAVSARFSYHESKYAELSFCRP